MTINKIEAGDGSVKKRLLATYLYLENKSDILASNLNGRAI